MSLIGLNGDILLGSLSLAAKNDGKNHSVGENHSIKENYILGKNQNTYNCLCIGHNFRGMYILSKRIIL